MIGGDHGKGAFRAIIKLDKKFTSGINITRIFRLVNVQCKKENHEIPGNTVMAQIGDRLNNIYAGHFLGWTHEGKT